MSEALHDATSLSDAQAPAWGAVVSMMLGVFGLVTAEFLPASLLTPMARDLGLTEGMAGQAVTATAAVALVASLLVAMATRGVDRRIVLLGFSTLLIVSNLLVASATSLPLLLLGRILLGTALGGFWAIAAATTMRLVPGKHAPRALSIIFSGVSLATIFAAPFGSFVGDLAGWRVVFVIAAGLGVLALAAQFATLPPLPASGHANLKTLIDVLKRPRIGAGMLAVVLMIAGHFALFTYIRPFLETVTHIGGSGMTGILLAFGAANFFGTLLGGFLLERDMRLTLLATPVTIGALAWALVAFGGAPWSATVLIALWGVAFGAVPVAWSTWIARAVPDEAESGGGLMVAAFQVGITIGASSGGLVFDASGAKGVFIAAGIVLLAAALVVLTGVRAHAGARGELRSNAVSAGAALTENAQAP